jgi:hypothetical protein
MQKNREPAAPEHMTDAEIMLAIRYLDPDLTAHRTAVEGGTILGICITLLTMLPGAMSYICPYDAGPDPAPLVDRLKNISYCVAAHSRILKARSTPAEITLGTQPGKHSIVTGEQR